MVFISRQAKIDLDNIVIGLLEWEKIELTVGEVMQYVDDIVTVCYQLDSSFHHHKATYNDHLKHGTYSYPYKRNKQTTWYIIYDVNMQNNILVNKIISKYKTIS
jgi:mRNA-degrading endonuclease YafQ of YafQ-DinJ toxin-antitoxin module